MQALGAAPARRCAHRPRPGRLPRGRAQGDRRLRAGDRGPGVGAQGARPLRLQPDRADDAALRRRHGDAGAAGRAAEPAGARRGRPRRRLDRGRDVRLERSQPRCPAGRGLPHPRPRDPATPGDEGADARAAPGRDRGAGRDPPRRGLAGTARASRRRRRRLPPMFGKDRPHRRRRRGHRRGARALRGELRDDRRPPRDGRVAGRRGGAARRRRRARRADAAAGRPTPRSASSSPARAPSCITSPTRSTTSTRPWRSSPPPGSS